MNKEDIKARRKESIKKEHFLFGNYIRVVHEFDVTN